MLSSCSEFWNVKINGRRLKRCDILDIVEYIKQLQNLGVGKILLLTMTHLVVPVNSIGKGR